MNHDYMYFINALIIFLLCYFVYAYVLPVIRKHFIFLLVKKLTSIARYYNQYTLHLRPSDWIAYVKYQLWHYYERRKLYSM